MSYICNICNKFIADFKLALSPFVAAEPAKNPADLRLALPVDAVCIKFKIGKASRRSAGYLAGFAATSSKRLPYGKSIFCIRWG